MQAYDTAGLATGDAPPTALRALVREAGVLVSSDLPRTRASAALLAADAATVTTSALLRELRHPLPSVPGIRLPLPAWALTIGLRRTYGRLRGEQPGAAAIEQAAAAADWLAALAGERGTVVAVTHVSFRALLARTLGARNWALSERMGRYRPWSAWSLVPR